MRIFFSLLLSLFFVTSNVDAAKKKTVCLNMIVKDETQVIERCLNSVKPIIDYWVIVDTGSTDGTQKMIKEIMKDVPGELHERPWVNFGHNRNEALQLAHNKGDYLLFIDADEEFAFDEDFTMPELDKGAYSVRINHSGSHYYRKLLVNNHLDWKWTGVLHEFLGCAQPYNSEVLEKVVNIYRSEGNRSQDPQKFQKDAAVLEAALKDEPDNSRYVFYLAQSYRDAGENELALENYQKRVSMGGWDQEVFWSKYQIAFLQEKLKKDPGTVIQSYCDAYQYRPTRVEPLGRLASYFRGEGNHLMGYLVANYGLSVPKSDDILFVEGWVHDYWLLFERSVSAYWIGKYEEALQDSKELLAKPHLPKHIRECVELNIGWANAKIGELKEPLDTQLTSSDAAIDKTVLLAILARNKAHTLPKYLECIDKLEYNKKAITVYINTNNNSDETEKILRVWAKKNKKLYKKILFDAHSAQELKGDKTRPHLWSPNRLKVLGGIREKSMQKAIEHKCDFYFVADCDNFLTPPSLKTLVSKNKPIIAPMLEPVPGPQTFVNFFYGVTPEGHYKDHPLYSEIRKRSIKGTFAAPFVDCTYLIRSDEIPNLGYIDSSEDLECIIFSRIAREQGVEQYICNEMDFGTSFIPSRDIDIETERKIAKQLLD